MFFAQYRPEEFKNATVARNFGHMIIVIYKDVFIFEKPVFKMFFVCTETRSQRAFERSVLVTDSVCTTVDLTVKTKLRLQTPPVYC